MADWRTLTLSLSLSLSLLARPSRLLPSIAAGIPFFFFSSSLLLLLLFPLSSSFSALHCSFLSFLPLFRLVTSSGTQKRHIIDLMTIL